MATNKKKTAKKTTTKTARRGGRVPTDEERRAKGQIRRTLRLSDAADAAKFETLEAKYGTSGAVGELLRIYETYIGPIE